MKLPNATTTWLYIKYSCYHCVSKLDPKIDAHHFPEIQVLNVVKPSRNKKERQVWWYHWYLPNTTTTTTTTTRTTRTAKALHPRKHPKIYRLGPRDFPQVADSKETTVSLAMLSCIHQTPRKKSGQKLPSAGGSNIFINHSSGSERYLKTELWHFGNWSKNTT